MARTHEASEFDAQWTIPIRQSALPVLRDLSFVTTLTGVIGLLLLVSSIGGLLYGAIGWYDPDPDTLPVFLGQDVLTLVFGLPLLVGSAWRARSGSARGLVCWMGALFYIAYSYYFYVVGARFNAFFPIYIAIVSMSMFGLLDLLFAVDFDRVADRFGDRTPVQLIGTFLIGTAIFVALAWLWLTISALLHQGALDRLPRAAIAVDGVVLLPLLFVGGLWVRRRQPMGFVLAGMLLVKVAATCLTLVVHNLGPLRWGQAIDSVQTAAYAVGLAAALALLAAYFRHVDGPDVG